MTRVSFFFVQQKVSTEQNFCFFLLSEVQDRVMLTGRHMVRDVSCKNCDAKLGWVYEFATDDNQRYKEGRVILERALISESDGMGENI